MLKVQTGLTNFINDTNWQKQVVGNIAYLTHSAAVDDTLEIGISKIRTIFKDRLKCLIGPQHGIVSDVQDNMIETSDFSHPYFKLPVYSLYSKTRSPTTDMLKDIQTVIVDLQDVGTRVYTYISTLSYMMDFCATNKIQMIILDRPNPIGGLQIEGNVLEKDFYSFVGMYPFPQRHGLTIAEVALYKKHYDKLDIELTIVPLKNWKRSMYWQDTGLEWINPSPNLPTSSSTITFAGTVLFEGTNISEGRGTTRSLEIIGHPKIEPFSLQEEMLQDFKQFNLNGFYLRPITFMPTFQKHAQKTCGGYQIHITNKEEFNSWNLSQYLCYKFSEKLKDDFLWKQPPYEYEYDRYPIDLINGTDQIRKMIDSKESFEKIISYGHNGHGDFIQKRNKILIYE